MQCNTGVSGYGAYTLRVFMIRSIKAFATVKVQVLNGNTFTKERSKGETKLKSHILKKWHKNYNDIPAVDINKLRSWLATTMPKLTQKAVQHVL